MSSCTVKTAESCSQARVHAIRCNSLKLQTTTTKNTEARVGELWSRVGRRSRCSEATSEMFCAVSLGST